MRNSLNTSIGKRVREEREKYGYSREYLAEKLEISSRFLADIELGTKGMSFSTLIKISDELNLSTDYILRGKNSELKSGIIKNIINDTDEKYLDDLEKILIAFSNAIKK